MDKRQLNLLPIPYVKKTGLGAVVARTSGGREVASSILVAPTIHLNSVLEIIRLLLCTGGTSHGVNASSTLVAPTIKKSTKKDTTLVSFVLIILHIQQLWFRG